MPRQEPTATTAPPGSTAPGARGWLRATFSSLQVRNFRIYYAGQTASMIGTWMRRTALGWVVYEMTGSRAMLGTVMGMALLPMFLLSPLAGTIADRVDKRRMVILTQLLAACSSALIALLLLTGWAQVWHLLALATLGGIAFAFEVPARQAFVSEIVGREHLLNAVALNSVLVNSSRVLGPAVAGLVMAAVGAGWCFLLDAASYLVVTGTLLALRLPPHRPPARRTSHWQDLLEGFREAHRNDVVRTLLLLLCLMGVFGWACQTLMPAIAQDLLHLGEWEYGLLTAMFGVGAIAGALVVAARTASGTSRLQVFGGVWLLCVGALAVAASRHPVPMGAGLAVAGFGAVMFMSTSNTLVQMSVEDGLRGRIMGIWSVGFGGALPAGSFLAGWLAQLVSPYLTIAVFAAILAAASLLIWRRLPPPASAG
ncbi:MAG: MFS transporter [bacterium]|nr:MFS transporter [bacterium]